MIVGETASADDELLGEPFMSREGDYLRKLLQRAGIDPGDCYLTLAVKCPAPGPREPTTAQVQACDHWLVEELNRVQPRVVLTLGALPSRVLLGLKKSFRLSQVVGQMQPVLFPWAGSIIPWYSANYLLQRGQKLERQTLSLLHRLKVHLV